MAKKRHVQLGLLAFCLILAMGAPAVAFAGSPPPDLTPCLNNGFKYLETDLGFPFNDEKDCLLFAALGGSFGDLNGSNEADFYITNLTGRNIQLRHIQFNDSHSADDVTFGVPSQWPTGTLLTPLDNPNWPVNSVLKLKFTYSAGSLTRPGVDWELHLVDLPNVNFSVSYWKEPGWHVECSTSFAFCLSTHDGVHTGLVKPFVVGP